MIKKPARDDPRASGAGDSAPGGAAASHQRDLVGMSSRGGLAPAGRALGSVSGTVVVQQHPRAAIPAEGHTVLQKPPEEQLSLYLASLLDTLI